MLNAMRQQAQAALGDVALPSTGIVRSYDPVKYAVRLELQPQGNMTGWIPLLTPWVGNGWGMFCPPTIGDLVEVTFLNGDINSGVAGLRAFNDQDLPLPVPSGEFWLVHAAGALLKLNNDGKVLINSQIEIDATAPTVQITAAGAVNIVAATASVTATTSASVTAPSITLGAAAQTLKSFITDAFISLFNGHTHNDPHGGVSGAPNQPMTAAHATTTVKGG
ncbi:hypothetical protein KIV45_15920 [Janthinobacterium lividum]|nr:hypothetical protein KIV45_15920 [Janthinobacterium lividum]